MEQLVRFQKIKSKITPLSQSTDRHIRQLILKQGDLEHTVSGE